MSKWLPSALLLLPLLGCQPELPAPSYPVPQDPPLEQTDLYPYFEPPAEAEPEDDEWEDTGEGWGLEPTTDEPTTDEPTTDEPTTDEPTTDEPAESPDAGTP